MKTYNQLLEENKKWAEEVFANIDKKLAKVTVRNTEKIADGCDESGMFKDCRDISWWTNGFWGGLNHLLYEKTGNEDYLKTAQANEKRMDEALYRKYGRLHHDVGFMWHILAGANYRLHGDEESKDRNLHAAATLMARFVIDGGYIIAWNGKAHENWTIIDCLMNLSLLYWASEETGDDRFKRVAMAHADMAIMDHLREDGSVVHIAEHDRETGDVVATYAGQGCAFGSSWSRGQAWALYGFMISYLHTKEERYLNAAKQVANYFIANCSDDWLPRVDFRGPAEPVMIDTSASACAACGLIELAKALPEAEGGMYMHAAMQLMHAMDDKCANYDDSVDYLVSHGTVRFPIDGDWKKAEVHVPIIYTDFFYTEAILKVLGSTFNPW